MTERQIKRGRNEINKLTDEGEKYFSKPAAEDSSSSLADLEIWDVFALVKPPPHIIMQYARGNNMFMSCTPCRCQCSAVKLTCSVSSLIKKALRVSILKSINKYSIDFRGSSV